MSQRKRLRREVVRQANAQLALSGGIGSEYDEEVLHPQRERWSLFRSAFQLGGNLSGIFQEKPQTATGVVVSG